MHKFSLLEWENMLQTMPVEMSMNAEAEGFLREESEEIGKSKSKDEKALKLAPERKIY